MADIAIIGGSGLTSLQGLEITYREIVSTPFGEPSAPVIHGTFCEKDIVFLPRHGSGHTIPPHKINYRANVWTLKELGVSKIISIAAVGTIRKDLAPGSLVIPDQLIDYTWNRVNTFFEEGLNDVVHIDFTHPYCEELRQALIKAGKKARLKVSDHGVYGVTQGPRLETAAEIRKLESDGCDMVGMTGMPEAALARELGLCYATCAVSANWAAGKSDDIITMEEIHKNLHTGVERVRKILENVLPYI